MSEKLKAYWIEFDEISAWYCASTGAKARALAAYDIVDAYQISMGEAFIGMTCLRAPKYDDRAKDMENAGHLPIWGDIGGE